MRLFWCLALIICGCVILNLASCTPDSSTTTGGASGTGKGGGTGPGAGNGGGNGGGTGGIGGTDGATGGATGGTSGGDTYVPPVCGQQTFPIALSQSAPNVLLVLDKSGSMQDQIPGTTMTKWDTAKMAISTLLMQYTGKVRWGLAIFPRYAPGADKCDAGDLQIPFGDDRAAAIDNLLAPITSAMIGGSTPTETTLQNLQITGGLNDLNRNNYILLLTDGIPTCNQDGKVTPVVASLYAQSPSVRTFVVGLGAETDSNPAQLDEWAVAGHTDRTGATHKYYQANNITDLNSAFAEIAAGVASCTYQLQMAPQDPSLIIVQLDGQNVQSDPTNGVTYDPGAQSITLHGTSCDSVKSGKVKNVNLIYGCPLPPVG